MTKVRRDMLNGLNASAPELMALPWRPIGFLLLGEEVLRLIDDEEQDLEMVKAWWLDESGNVDAPIHRILLEFRLRTESTAFRSFQDMYVDWTKEFFKRLRDRFLLAERELFVYYSSETREPSAHLKMAWLEVWEWDALDQHPGRREIFDLAAIERTNKGESG